MISAMASRYRAVALGVSTGGVEALRHLLPALPADFPLPLLIVIHIAPGAGDGLANLLDHHAQIRVKEADEGEAIENGVAYLAPADYHLLVEPDGRLGLSTDPVVNYARPSVDVLFESAAACFGPSLIGVVLTGAGSDGARGLERIGALGGYTIVQQPQDARMASMPDNALARVRADCQIALAELPALLMQLAGQEGICSKP
jgi:two-component system chemotaxis response regulator CheB